MHRLLLLFACFVAASGGSMSSIDLYWVFSDISQFSAIPGILYFLFFMRKRRGVPMIIFLILLISFLFDFGTFIYIKYFKPNSYFGSNWWVILNFFLISALFKVSSETFHAGIQSWVNIESSEYDSLMLFRIVKETG